MASIVFILLIILCFIFLDKPKFVFKVGYQKEKYQESFDKYKNTEKKKVIALTVSHHFLAKDLIAQSFASINHKNIKNIIIISPDHFNQLNNNKCMANTINHAVWKNPFGLISTNNVFMKKITQSKICLDSTNFKIEHGVSTLIPFINYYFPKSKIIPLVLKQSQGKNYFFNLGQDFYQKINPDQTLLVVSSDFSHYVSNIDAQKADQKSIDIIKNQDFNRISDLQNDCPQCIAFMFGYLKNQKTNFELVYNKNSFDLSDQDQNFVTSYVGSYFVK